MTELPHGTRPTLARRLPPNCVRGLETAEAHGWIDLDPTSDTFRGLNALVAWVFSGGSIATDTWTPYFRVETDRDEAILDRAADLAGTELDFTRSAADARAQEMRPVEHGSVLGRVLSVLGAPRGSKRDDAELRLPAYLETAPDRVAREAVQVYLHNRARQAEDGPALHITRVRSATFREGLADLIGRLTGKPVRVEGSTVVIPPAAARQIAVWEPLFGIE